jgi:hypothetical protein
MIEKEINWFGRKCILACDAQCQKAWGINRRPKRCLSDDPDDYAFLADAELGTAPVDPGTYEGEHAKPRSDGERLNKWCARECERSRIVERGETIRLPDFARRRVYNIPSRHEVAS